eukprot:6484264-Amphidinium_carterae.1
MAAQVESLTSLQRDAAALSPPRGGLNLPHLRDVQLAARAGALAGVFPLHLQPAFDALLGTEAAELLDKLAPRMNSPPTDILFDFHTSPSAKPLEGIQ